MNTLLRPVDNYFLQKSEPEKSCLQALRKIILEHDPDITEAWKYGMPFYCIKGKMCCYLWMHKKYKQPYIGIVEGASIHQPGLLTEKRARMKIMLIDPGKDLPLKTIRTLLKEIVGLYK